MDQKPQQLFYYPYEVPIPQRGYVNIFRNKSDGLRYIRTSDGSHELIRSSSAEFYNLGKVKGASNYTSDNIEMFVSDSGLVVRFMQLPQQIIIPGGGGNAPSRSQNVSSQAWMLNGNAVTAVKSIGTTSLFDFPIIVNNIERGRFKTTGNFQLSGIIEDAFGIISVAPSARNLYDTSNQARVSWDGAGTLSDSSGVQALDWTLRVLSDSSGANSIDFTNRVLYDASSQAAISYSGSERFLINTADDDVLGWGNGFQIDAGDNANRNISFGYNANATAPTAGMGNSAFGINALASLTTGASNTAIGSNALQSLQDGLACVAIGELALGSNISGVNNTAVGASALSTLDSNHTAATAVGYRALHTLSQDDSTAVGAFALEIATAYGNDAFGAYSLQKLTSGGFNIALGILALGKTVTGSRNTAVGITAGQNAVAAASDNVYVGYQSGYFNNNTGDGTGTIGKNQNTFVGTYSGLRFKNSGSVLIGYNAGATQISQDNILVIDNDDNPIPLIFGDFSKRNIGLGTITPAQSAILDLTSTSGALLVPRMTTAQKNALTAVNGMIVYDTTLGKFQGYEAGAWTNFV